MNRIVLHNDFFGYKKSSLFGELTALVGVVQWANCPQIVLADSIFLPFVCPFFVLPQKASTLPGSPKTVPI